MISAAGRVLLLHCLRLTLHYFQFLSALTTALSEFILWCSDVKYPGKVGGLVSAVHHKLNYFFLFQLNAHNGLNTGIYHHLPPTCFGLCYTTFRETTALLAQKIYAFCNVSIKYTIPVCFFNLQCCYSGCNNTYFVLL